MIEINGPRYTSLATNVVNDILNRRKDWLIDLAGRSLQVSFRTIHRTASLASLPNSSDPMLDSLNAKWMDALSKTYDTRHYLTITTQRGKNSEYLTQAADQFIQVCPEFHPKIVTNEPDEFNISPLATYLFELANGHTAPTEPLAYDLSERLVECHIEPKLEGPIRQSSDLQSKYYGTISVVEFGDDTALGAIPKLLALNVNFEILVNSLVLSPQQAHTTADYRAKQAKVRFDNPLIKEEWDQTKTEIHAGRETIAETSFLIIAEGDTEAELIKSIQLIKSTLSASSWKSIVEEVLGFRAFLSRWPGSAPSDRKRSLLTVNLVDVTPMAGAAKGNLSSPWGPSPIRYFPTAGEFTPYALTYHPTTGDDASPHDVIIAGTRSGKTVFDTFRASGAYSAHPDLRQVFFDRNKGIQVFTAYMGGQYLNPDDETMALNPFDAPDSPATRKLQERLIQAMTKTDSPEGLRVISTAVADANNTSDGVVTLEQFHSLLLPQGPVKNALEPWITNERYRAIFGGKKDAFDPSASRVTTIALDALVDDPLLAGTFAFYLLSRIQTGFVANGFPYRITVDEASTLLADPAICDLILSEIRTAAKNNGQVTTIWQDFTSLQENARGKSIIANIGTLYIWPGTAESESQCDDVGSFRFTETEKQFVMGTWKPPRSIKPVLVKREHESAFIETDLSRLGLHLRMFRGGFNVNRSFARCQKEFPSTWRQQFLDSSWPEPSQDD